MGRKVARRRTQHLLAKALSRKHTLEGLLVALANIDEVIKIIRSSKSQAEAKERLCQLQAPAALLERALGADGFAVLREERGAAESYGLPQRRWLALIDEGHAVTLGLDLAWRRSRDR
jgi:DNA gyrase subunit A